MDDFDPAELERIRRFGRVDWRCLWRPGWERGLNSVQVAAQRKEFAKWERAFETPLARRLRKQQEEREREEQALAWDGRQRELLAIRRELDELKCELAARRLAWERADETARVKCDIAFERFVQTYTRYAEQQKAGFNPDQPRDELGKWKDGGDGGNAPSDAADAPRDGESLAQDRLPRTPASDQPPRSDRPQLETIANDPLIRAYMNEAWAASNPYGIFPREHGFWISRDEISGQLFTRPFATSGVENQIDPGSPPPDAIAFFHTHPYGGIQLGAAPPSPRDEAFATRVGLPGLIQSHVGVYYFGPPLRPAR